MPKGIPHCPPELIKAVAEKRAVLFVGAGISRTRVAGKGSSASKGLPVWQDLLLSLVQNAKRRHLASPKESEELRRAVEGHKFSFVAEAIREKMRGDFYNALEAIISDSSVEPNSRHRLIVRMPFAAIVTTNYDDLIERAYSLEHQKQATTCTADNADSIIRALMQGEFFILKAHGNIKDRRSVVLSERDYRDMMHRKPGYVTALQTIFLTKTVLFIGTSLTDQDIIRVLETLKESFGEHSPQKHFALVPKERAGKLECDFWKDFYGIELLTYEDHAHVEPFLEVLHEEVKRISSPLSWDERVPEAKWYPDKRSLKAIERAMENQMPRLLGCGLPNKGPTLEEANILFDTPEGVLFEMRLNLSIKVIALRKNRKVTDFEARWMLIKLLDFADDKHKFWDTDRKADDPKPFPYSGDIREDIKKIAKNLRMSPEIREILKTKYKRTRADVDPAVVIAVKRQQWDFEPGVKWKTGLKLYISHVNIYPYSQRGMYKLPREFEALLSQKVHKNCVWDELEIEEHGDSVEDIREFSSHFSKLEREYGLSKPRKPSQPIAKYHHAVAVLRELHTSQKALGLNNSLFEGWLPFLKEA